MSTSSTNSSLRPAWQSRGNQGGGRGFQPPPQVATERANNNPRSQSFGSGGGSGHHHPHRSSSSSHTDSKHDAENNRRDSSNFNKFAALDDDDDLVAEATATTTSTSTNNSSNNNKSSNSATTSNSRSEGFRNAVLSGSGTSTTNASNNTSGSVARNISSNRTGMSLSDLAANAPERERSGSISGSGRFGAGRSNSIGEYRNELTTTSSTETSSAAPAPPVKVTRFTRERLLSMRPRPLDKPPAKLLQIAGESKSAILTDEPQDPVCWDTFDAEEIWATVAASSAVRRTASTGVGKGGPPPLGSTSTGIPSEDANAIRRSVSTGLTRNTSRGESTSAASGGRWQRGVALPPPDQTIRKPGSTNRDRDADDPSDLWDDPGSATDGGAAADFSAFGSTIPKMDGSDSGGTADNAVFDFEKMTEATKKFEEELHGSARSRTSSTGAGSDADVDDTGVSISKIRVDPKRPLATVGTTIRSGSGDDVNVFEDFDDPASSEGEPDETNATTASTGDASKVDKDTTTTTPATTRTTSPPAIKAIDEDPDASSRLMALIGIKKDEPSSILGGPDPIISSLLAAPSTAPGPVTSGNVIEAPKLSSTWGLPDPIIAPKINESGTVLGLSLNPWGGPMLNSVEPMHGLDLQARLREAEVEQQKAREEELRRRQEQEEAQRRLAQQQAEQERVRLQQLQQQQQQQQQGVGVQSQVENVLMERISTILENSWGRSDLVSILTTLHSEDTRVIPLLSTVDALRALLLRNPQRVAIRQDPALRAEMAALLITNAQWQQRQQQQAAAAAAAQQQQQVQQQRLRAQQEELQRREQQRRLEEQQQQQAAAAARAAQQQQRQQQGAVPILPDAPWYYSDPQKNIQGPFRGDEMRQWLEAGYFKGDLPISQQPMGPFRPLSAIFPDFSVAFSNVASNPPLADNRAARAAAEERARIEAAEKQAQAEAAAAAAAAERDRLENERRAKEVERRAREAAAERQRMLVEREHQQQQLEQQQRLAKEAEATETDKPSSVNGSNGGNESSAQLKMLLGLNSQFAKPSENVVSAPEAGTAAPAPTEPAPSTTTTKTSPPPAASTKPATEKKTPKTSNKVVSQLQPVATETAPAPAPVPATVTPAAPAWGGAAVNKTATRKTMSEIQKEEARAAASAAMRQDNKPSSSGWANVAAARGGSNAWSGGAASQKPAVVLTKPASSIAVAATTATRAPTRVTSSGSAPVASSQAPMQRSVSASGNGNTTSTAASGASAAPADAFGAKMSPQLEKWCKDQMQKLNGTEDLTLVSFCMTLSDPVEIRQYITTYLGTTPQVNNFATEFINRTQKGGSTKEKTEEWESTVAVNKKNRKKKPTAGGTATANR